MTSKFARLSIWLAVVVVFAGLLALLRPTVTGDQVAQADSDDLTVELLEVPPELTARWWQWGFEIPADRNSLSDPSGEFCDEGQPDDVWYLAGVFDISATGVERECEIPDRRPILIPIINLVCLEVDGDIDTFGSLEECLDFLLPFIDEESLTLTITGDDDEVLDLSDEISQVRSPNFEINFPDNNIKGLDLSDPTVPNPSRARSDGYWVLLRLPPGEYTVNFSGAVPDFGFALDITYKIEVLNQVPDCSNTTPSIETLWPANHKFVSIDILGVTDPEGDSLALSIDSIYQDEPVDSKGDGSHTPDGQGVGTATAEVRAERAGGGNGRVYHINSTADDGHGGSCSSEVLVGVPHDKKGIPVDNGALYDSTVP